MNHYDKEENIINLLQSIPLNEICMVNPTRNAKKFFYSLYCERKFRNWINSSGKDAPPPDFFSEKYEYMLEVMRSDDYLSGPTSPNALESELVKKLENMHRQAGMPSIRDPNIQMLVVPDMSRASANGYQIYIENFKRIVQKHVQKIPNYQKNHKGYKLGFLIFDEAPGYLKVSEKKENIKAGEGVWGFPHLHYRDKNLVESFYDADVDFIIWITPYKNTVANPLIYPSVCVFDLKYKTGWKNKLIEYKVDEMQCIEVD